MERDWVRAALKRRTVCGTTFQDWGSVMRGLISALSAQSSAGLSLIRLLAGLVLCVSGYQKVFVAGLGNTAFFEKIGIIVPQITWPFIGLLELIGGALLFLGLFTRYLGLIFAIEFVVAAWAKMGPMDQGWGGARIDLFLLISGLLFATNGGGKLALDAMLKRWDA
jgi:putative oxidoreductase